MLVTHCRDGDTGDEVIPSVNEGTGDWLLAVRRLTEGFDIKRLRVGAYLSGTTTRQMFEQSGGRFERLLDGVPPDDQDALIIASHFSAFVADAGEYERATKDVDVRRRLLASECACCGRPVPAALGTCPYCRTSERFKVQHSWLEPASRPSG